MKTRQIFGTLVIVIALLASHVQVASAATTKFRIRNKIGTLTDVKLTGPAIYTVPARPGVTTVVIEKGTYTYSYYACGKTYTGTINVRSTNDELELPKCPVSSAAATGTSTSTNAIQVRINNRTGATLTLTLRGPATYYLELISGMNKIQVAKGTYTYSYYACGTTLTGTFKATSTNAELKLPPCPAAGSTNVEGGKTTRIKVKNDTGGNMTLYLYGPANYTLTLIPGINLIYVVKGKYTYYAYSVCGYKSDVIEIKPGFEWRWWCNK